MNLFKRIFGHKKTSQVSSDHFKPGGIPYKDTTEFKTHNEVTKTCFKYLITDFGFKGEEPRWMGREYLISYHKDHLTVKIILEPNSLPNVVIVNHTLPYNEQRREFNSDDMEFFSPKLSEIRKQRRERTEPIVRDFMRNWEKTDVLDMSRLASDYEENGRQEHTNYLLEAADTLRDHLEKKRGVVEALP